MVFETDEPTALAIGSLSGDAVVMLAPNTHLFDVAQPQPGRTCGQWCGRVHPACCRRRQNTRWVPCNHHDELQEGARETKCFVPGGHACTDQAPQAILLVRRSPCGRPFEIPDRGTDVDTDPRVLNPGVPRRCANVRGQNSGQVGKDEHVTPSAGRRAVFTPTQVFTPSTKPPQP